MRAPSKSVSLPPPVGGWDTENALADMPSQNAVVLDNWFPETDKVTLRRGYSEHATGLSGSVETILSYSPPSGSAEFFAVNDGKVYDITAPGAVTTALVTGLANDRWQDTQIGTAGGHFLFMVNGEDTPLIYNGSTWTTASITGPTANNLVWCNLHQRRLWFGEINSLTAWYLPVNSISGTAAQFPMAGLAKLGGSLVAMGTWTRDGGDGTDDVAVFITSEGEAIVYAGTDPSDANLWALVGVFRIGRPIGRRCVIKAGADLIMMTQDGFVSASSILSLDRSQTQRVALSKQINKAVNDAQRLYRSEFGWQPIIYPTGAMLIFNIPQGGGRFHQYVFNTLTGAPCRFTGIDAVSWALFGDRIFFGGTDGNVYEFDTIASDNGDNIRADAIQAFSYFGQPGMKKAFKLAEPLFESNGNPNAAVELNVDFQIRNTTATPAPSTSLDVARWGSARWGVSRWAAAALIFRGWRGVRGIGRAGSVRVRVATQSVRPSWISTNVTYVPGGQL